jgi:hypothetical protein
MAAKLVEIHCGNCGNRTYRHRAAYEDMLAQDGQVRCLLCSRPRFGACANPRELLDVAQALNASSMVRVAETRHHVIRPA